MRFTFWIAVVVATAGRALAVDNGPGASPLRVQYVGNKDTDRGRSYARFLSEKFVLVGAADRPTFDPGSITGVDVVVLDWSQGDTDSSSRATRGSAPESDLRSPLGVRSRWTKPTVLLGSAGHLLAAPWKVFGGSG